MAESSVVYSYEYPSASSLVTQPGSAILQLATSKLPQPDGAASAGNEAQVYPYFFEGKLLQPRTTALLLFLLSKVVSTRFYIPPAMFKRLILERDPVITSGGDLLRFEGFSACCSTYSRVDLTPEAYSGTICGVGTTNVDFNSPMRAALASVRDEDRLALSVGPDEVKLKRGFSNVVERKVKLPIRWLKGFVEVQAYQSKMELRFTVGKAETIRFLRSLPTNADYRSSFWVIPSGNGLRLSQVSLASAGGVKVAGLERLALLKQIASLADELKIYAAPNGDSSEWQLRCGGLLYSMTISAEPSRGFSGEGQVLTDLAEADDFAIAKVQAALNWQSSINLADMATQCKMPAEGVRRVLGILGSRGLVGYDLNQSTYFCRRLPFDIGLVEGLHPRLKAARKLVAEGQVKILTRTGGTVESEVKGSDVNHRLTVSEDSYTCTCQWHSKYQGARGPCKHILAVKLALGMPDDVLDEESSFDAAGV
jgi:hypothetical protein